jgi:hypothetical protein
MTQHHERSETMDEDQYYAAAVAAGRLDIPDSKKLRKTRRKKSFPTPLLDGPAALQMVRSGIDYSPKADDGKGVAFAGSMTTLGRIRGTIRLLHYLRLFLASKCTRAKHPSQWGDTLTKPEARRHLSMLIHVAINRKAGIPDVMCRKQESDYQVSLWRDCRAVRDRVNCRVIVRRFETAEIRRRYGHLIHEED